MMETINGKRCLVLDENVTGAFVVTYGDTDEDGNQGVRAQAFVDIPFDGDDLPDPVFDSGEIEDIPMMKLPGRVGEALNWLAGIAEGAVGFASGFFGDEDED